MKKVSPKQYAQALYESLKGSDGNELKERISNFLELVKQKKDIKLLNKIFISFVEIYQQEEGIIEAYVTSSKPLTNVVKQEILNWIKKYSGRTATVAENIDESLLGGVVIKFGHTIVDASLKNNLKNLHRTLSK